MTEDTVLGELRRRGHLTVDTVVLLSAPLNVIGGLVLGME